MSFSLNRTLKSVDEILKASARPYFGGVVSNKKVSPFKQNNASWVLGHKTIEGAGMAQW